MKHNIFNLNLLGDGLMATPAMRAFASKLPPEDELYLFTQSEQHTYIYGWIPYFKGAYSIDFDKPPTDLEIPKVRGEWVDTKNGRSIFIDIGMAFNHATHFNEPYAQGYAKQLGVYPLEDLHYDAGVSEQHMNMSIQFYNENFIPAAGDRPIVIVSHVSRSCASRAGERPNKMLYPDVWKQVVEGLEKDYFLVFIAEKDEDNADIKGFGDCGYMDSVPIFMVGAFIKMCHLFITIENGMIILAQAIDANVLGIVGAVPPSFFWTGTKGQSLILDYAHRGPASIGAEKIISSVHSLSESIRVPNPKQA